MSPAHLSRHHDASQTAGHWAEAQQQIRDSAGQQSEYGRREAVMVMLEHTDTRLYLATSASRLGPRFSLATAHEPLRLPAVADARG